MKITGILATTVLMAAFTAPVLADPGHHPDEADAKTAAQTQMPNGMMPMVNGQMPMMASGKDGMPMMKMMEERHAMMQAHMTKMETHMANTEKLLQQLVELQKK